MSESIEHRTIAAMSQRFVERADEMAQSLRRVADEIEREARSSDNRVNMPPWSWRALLRRPA